jgi:hypothetical protein
MNTSTRTRLGRETALSPMDRFNEASPGDIQGKLNETAYFYQDGMNNTHYSNMR